MQRDRDGKPFATLPVTNKPFDIAKNPSELRDIARPRGPAEPAIRH